MRRRYQTTMATGEIDIVNDSFVQERGTVVGKDAGRKFMSGYAMEIVNTHA